MNEPLLHLLADGRPGVGAGHLGRSLALAQSWLGAQGIARLVGVPDASDWADRYRAAGIEVGEGRVAPDVLVVDGYRYPPSRVHECAAGAPIVSIDDHGTGSHAGAALVVDQNLGATDAPYGRPTAGVLAGPRYALLRPEVVACRPASPIDRSAPPHRIALAMGGDPTPATRQRFDAVAADLAAAHGLDVVVLSGIRDLGPVLADVDLALSAAGSTLWELALFGIPTVAVAVADNQVPVARRAGAAGLVVDAGDIGTVTADELLAKVIALAADPLRRQALAAAGQTAVDGSGARRVATAARSLLVRLRRARADDARQLWEWANDPTVRASAFDPAPIAWDDHVAWLQRLLGRDGSAVWIAVDPTGVPLGQVRVEVDGAGRGTVDVSLAPERRGQGWAGAVLAAIARRAAADLEPHGLRELVASVLVGNESSARAFVSADFTPGPDGSTGGRQHHTYTRPCDG